MDECKPLVPPSACDAYRPRADVTWRAICARPYARLVQEEWAHPSGAASFFLLRHADAPTEEFDPSVALGMGANRAYLASVVCQQSNIYGAAAHPALPIAAAAGLAATALKQARGSAEVGQCRFTPG